MSEIVGANIGIELPPDVEAQRVLDEANEALRNIDRQLLHLIARRLEVSQACGEAKEALGQPVYDGAQELGSVQRFTEDAEKLGVPESLARETISSIVAACRSRQLEPLNPGAE